MLYSQKETVSIAQPTKKNTIMETHFLKLFFVLLFIRTFRIYTVVTWS